MIHVLIVDDDVAKVREIAKVLRDTGVVTEESLTLETNANGAKSKLASRRFDLLVLDVVLPDTMHGDPMAKVGLELLEDLMSVDDYAVPLVVVGMSAVDDVESIALEKFRRAGITFVHFAPSETSWRSCLTLAVKDAVRLKDARLGIEGHRTDLLVLCALEDPELQEVLRNGWNWTRDIIKADGNPYHRAVGIPGSDHFVAVAAAAPRMGIAATAVLASKAISIFRPRFIAMAGVCAALRDDVNLGDVIAADPCWDWGAGKWTGSSKELRFNQAPHQLPLDVDLRNWIRQFSKESAVFSDVREAFRGDPPSTVLRMHIGPFASGAAVVANGDIAEFIRHQNRDVIGLDMEVYAVYAAADESTIARPRAFSFKSAMDHADPNKIDKVKRYAAYTSAMAVTRFAEEYLTKATDP